MSCNLDLGCHTGIAHRVQWMTVVSIWTGIGMLANMTWSKVKTAAHRATCYSLSGLGGIAPFCEASSLEAPCFPKQCVYPLITPD